MHSFEHSEVANCQRDGCRLIASLTDNSLPDRSNQAVPADTTLFNDLSSRRFESVIRLQVIIGKSVTV